jgi:hypothetical protein
MMKDTVYLALAAAFLTVLLVGVAAAELSCPAAQESGVPFHGTLHGTELDTVSAPPPTLHVDGSGTGTATHLGAFAASWLVTVDITQNPSPSTGTSEFIAANGDILFTDIVGEGTGAPVAQITECNVITGGTGRFAGATGAFTMHRVVDQPTGATSGSFVGTLVKHKGK